MKQGVAIEGFAKVAEFEIFADIQKADDELRVVYGWASIVQKDGKPVIDAQGDIVPVIELQKAAHNFVSDARSGGVMHIKDADGKIVKVGEIVESVIFTQDLQKALGVDLGQVGWFIGYRVEHDGIWDGIKKGDYPAFSIGGGGFRMEVDVDG